MRTYFMDGYGKENRKIFFPFYFKFFKNLEPVLCFSDFRILKFSEFLKPVLWWDISFYFKKNIFPEIPPPLSIKVCCEVDQEKRTAGALLTPDRAIDKKDYQQCAIHNKTFFISLFVNIIYKQFSIVETKLLYHNLLIF